MVDFLIILGIVVVIAVVFTPSSRRGSRPRRDKPEGLPWMGGAKKPRKKKYFWDD